MEREEIKKRAALAAQEYSIEEIGGKVGRYFGALIYDLHQWNVGEASYTELEEDLGYLYAFLEMVKQKVKVNEENVNFATSRIFTY